MKLTILSVIISFLSLAICDECEPGYFWSSDLGCNECFCSGVTDKCHAGSFYRKEMTIDFQEIRGFLEWPNKPVGPLEYYAGGWDIKYVFDGNDGNEAFVWEVPFKYHGNRTRMYGSLLKFNHKIQPTYHPRMVNPRVHLHILSKEVNLSYIVPEPEGDNSYYYTRLVKLTEEGAYIANNYPQRATKADVMRALISADRIIIHIGWANKWYIMLNSPKLYVAVDEPTSDDYRADWIELCDCPKGYSGESCESCAKEFREPCKDMEPCADQCNDFGICLGCPQCFEYSPGYHHNINDKSESVFGACESDNPEWLTS